MCVISSRRCVEAPGPGSSYRDLGHGGRKRLLLLLSRSSQRRQLWQKPQRRLLFLETKLLPPPSTSRRPRPTQVLLTVLYVDRHVPPHRH